MAIRKSMSIAIVAILLTVSTLTSATTSYFPVRPINGSIGVGPWPERGLAGRWFNRERMGALYADGVSEPIEQLNARNISNALFLGTFTPPPFPGPPGSYATPVTPDGASVFREYFGQVGVSHDVNRVFRRLGDLTRGFKVQVYPDDLAYRTDRTFEENFLRVADTNTELNSKTGYHEVPNMVTAGLDASFVYGSNEEVNSALRTNSGDGKLIMVTHPYQPLGAPFPVGSFDDLPPPIFDTGLTDGAFITVPPGRPFSAGDDRINENIIIGGVHTTYNREHNMHCDRYAVDSPESDDDERFEYARRLTVAQHQKIVMYDYVPAVLGPNYPIPEYTGFKVWKNLDTTYAFNVAFRYGHSSLAPWKLRELLTDVEEYLADLGELQSPAGQAAMGPLKVYEFPVDTDLDPNTPDEIVRSSNLPFEGQQGGPFGPIQMMGLAGGFETIMYGTLTSPAADVDIKFDESIRNVPGAVAVGVTFDLGAFDLVRLLDTGCPLYMEFRRLYYCKGFSGREHGCRRHARIYPLPSCKSNKHSIVDDLECFHEITHEWELAGKLREMFGKITNIPAFVGMIAEAKAQDSTVSRTVGGILHSEYINKRDADPYWFENDMLTQDEMDFIMNRTLGNMLEDHVFQGKKVQRDVFSLPIDEFQDLDGNDY